MIGVRNERLIGYARVSTNDQESNLQVDALLAYGLLKEHLFFDKFVAGNFRLDQHGKVAGRASWT